MYLGHLFISSDVEKRKAASQREKEEEDKAQSCPGKGLEKGEASGQQV